MYLSISSGEWWPANRNMIYAAGYGPTNVTLFRLALFIKKLNETIAFARPFELFRGPTDARSDLRLGRIRFPLGSMEPPRRAATSDIKRGGASSAAPCRRPKC